jgi:hypothetical protein
MRHHTTSVTHRRPGTVTSRVKCRFVLVGEKDFYGHSPADLAEYRTVMRYTSR